MAAGPLGGPMMGGGSTRSFPLPGSSCGIPSNATAYSVNVTVVPESGLGYLTIWPTGVSQPVVSTLNDFEADVVANAAIVPAGSSGAVSVYVTDPTHVLIDVNGYFLNASNGANNNTAFGLDALPLGSGGQNTGIGAAALQSNSSGSYNTAVGSQSLIANTSGSSNTALGYATLQANTTGSNNVAIGSFAGSGLGAGDSNNIDIGNAGVGGDSGVTRIGGIFGVGVSGGAQVVVSASGQLGVVASSQRYKEDITPMADASDKLMDLAPVTFRYKQAGPDGSKPLQYGLIAEDVAKVYPELAVYGKDGQVETLQYQQLPALLLNELQKQHQTIGDLEARIAELEQALKAKESAAAVAAK